MITRTKQWIIRCANCTARYEVVTKATQEVRVRHICHFAPPYEIVELVDVA